MNHAQNSEAPSPPAIGVGDSLISEAVAQYTHGVSILTVVAAYMDWAIHLTSSPAKQIELIQSMRSNWVAFMLWMQTSSLSQCTPCVLHTPQDKRFIHEAWKNPPFSWFSQSFLITERWWEQTMTHVHGVSHHNEEMASFMTRQFLDVFSPSNYVLTNPEVLQETINTRGANLINGGMNWWRDFLDLLAQRKPKGTEAFVPGKTVAVTPGKVVYQNHLIELIQYASSTASVYPEPVLIVPSWIMKYYILDLSSQNSLVKYLVDHGHTVFMISWRNPRAEDKDLSMDDYLKLGVLDALKQIGQKLPGKGIHGVGYCLGATLLAMAAATLTRQPKMPLKTLTLLAGQMDFREPGELGLFIDESQIAFLENIMWVRGYLDGPQMAGAFALINSKDLVWSKLVHEYLMGAKTELTDLRAWNADATRLPYRMHSEYLRHFYLENDLAEGRYEVNGEAIALQDLRLPIFVVSTEWDHVSPWKSVFKAHLLTDSEISFVLCSGGHNMGIVNPPIPAEAESKRHCRPTSYRMLTRPAEGAYVDPETWLSRAQVHEGSWWTAWQLWLAKHSAKKIPAKPIPQAKGLMDAPGSYVHEN